MKQLQSEPTVIREIFPSILYYGTPVILLSTRNADGTTNLTPLSSSWALGKMIVLGVSTSGQALENMQRHPECVINVPAPTQWEQVERLAPTTGRFPVPAQKAAMGFRHEPDKFAAAGFTPQAATAVQVERIRECPLQIEARVEQINLREDGFAIVETTALHVFAHDQIMLEQGSQVSDRYVDPLKWSPLIYNFRHYFGLGERVGKTFRAET